MTHLTPRRTASAPCEARERIAVAVAVAVAVAFLSRSHERRDRVVCLEARLASVRKDAVMKIIVKVLEL
jgi:hypothetical protein